MGIVTNFPLVLSIDETSNQIQRKQGAVSGVAPIARQPGQDLTPVANHTRPSAEYTSKYLEDFAMLVFWQQFRSKPSCWYSIPRY